MENLLYSELEYQTSYQKIKEILTKEKNREKTPTASLIGGQPGSGKSQLSKFILAQNRNTIAIDGDFIRSFCPDLTAVKKEYGLDYPKITQPFTNRVIEQLIDELSAEHYNLIIEGTLRDISNPLKTAEKLNGSGYTVELCIIATEKDISWQSTIDRGNEMKKRGEMPRYVDKMHHDSVVASLPETVNTLFKNKIFDNVMIINRDKEILYDKSHKGDTNPKEIMEKSLNGKKVKTKKNKYIIDKLITEAKEGIDQEGNIKRKDKERSRDR